MKHKETLFWKEDEPGEILESIQLTQVDFSADIFLHGVCGFFALALNKKFGYDIVAYAEENIMGLGWYERLIHLFCRKGDAFIDVRGVTEDEDAFLDEFSDFASRYSECFQIQPEELEKVLQKEMSQEEYQNFLEAAEELINRFQEGYTVSVTPRINPGACKSPD